ncbi:MAG: LysM peptidoglycan-binding domain-containing protein [Verrucomicrobia bacterium]|nr:LysM peptidoglycan-binding domain-containing protein [Verrucomicrobiota bacterium]
MKRVFILLLIASSLALLCPASFAQDQSAAAAAAAARQDAEERYRHLSATVEELQAALDVQRRRIDTLAGELKSFRDESARTGHDAVTREEFKDYAEKLRELAQKQDADRKLILDEIKKLATAPLVRAPEKKAAAEPPKAAAKPDKEETGYEYVIKEKDTLSAIVVACREKGLKVTVKQVLEANPKVNPNRLLPGQKIFIPAPSAP